MNNNYSILFSDFGPYHVARIDALANALKASGSDLYAYRFSETSSFYGWKSSVPANATVITLGRGAQSDKPGVLKAIGLAIAFGKSLRKQKVRTAFMPSYAPLPNLLCALSAKMAGCKIILMNESWKMTERSSLPGKLVKHFMVRQFNSALVGGTPQKQYACDYGQDPAKVFLGYDAVDVKYYEAESAQWKEIPAAALPVANLPARFFLSLGRFASKKNIPLLITAYGGLLKRYPQLDIALVIVGEGPEEAPLKKLAFDLQIPVRDGIDGTNLPGNKAEIVFYPFQQIDKTPLFFARCEAFILPSLYEEWGLVVNEAMACGAAVVVSENVGCVQDLVLEGVNGFRFNPQSVEQLETILEKFVTDPALSERQGEEGRMHIRNWGTPKFVEGALQAIAATVA